MNNTSKNPVTALRPNKKGIKMLDSEQTRDT